MYTGTTVLGEISELQYSLSPSYQAAASCFYKQLAYKQQYWDFAKN